MPENDVVRARIDRKVKEEASLVLKAMGLTPSDAYRMLMVRIAREKHLPFEPLVPNAKTMAAIKAARQGKLRSVNGVDDLLSELNADD